MILICRVGLTEQPGTETADNACVRVSADTIATYSPGGSRALFGMILRVYSYLYHLVLCLFLIGISVVAITSSNTLKLAMLPWTGADLTTWLFWGSLAGLLSIVLAITGVFRFLFPIWAAAVLFYMARGYLFQPYTFSGDGEFSFAMWMIAGALLAFLASLTLLRAPRSRRAA